MVLAREGAGGCESGVVCGRIPMFTRYWFTAARAALVIVSTSWCVVGGEKSSFRVVSGHDACVPNAGVCVGSERGGGRAGVRYWFALFAEGTVGLNHRSDRGRDKNAVLALNIVGCGRPYASFPRMSRYP